MLLPVQVISLRYIKESSALLEVIEEVDYEAPPLAKINSAICVCVH